MRLTLLLVVARLAEPALGAAQETSGDVRGRVRSPAVEAVASAQITATSPDLLGVRRAVSARDGVFHLLALPPGTYTIRIAAIGHRPVVIRDVPVQLGRTTGLGDVALDPAAVELSELTITAPAVTLDPVRTTIGATLEADDYAALPAERDYKSLIAILPHVNTSYHGDPVNVGGSTGLENMYFIDGVNVTAPFRATTGTSLPYNFVRSVEVRAGGYEAQYGRALGAIVNAVTYTGTNAFEASVFGFFTHSALAVEPKAQPTLMETGAYSYDVGTRLSGPVVRDRLWFSAAYNPRISRAEREIAGLGTFSDESRADIFAGKLTWHAMPAANLELSVFGDPTTHHEVASIPYLTGLTPLNADPYLHRVETGGISVSLRATATLGRSLLIEASLGRSTGRENFVGETDRGRTESPFVDYISNTLEGGVPFPSTVSQARTAGVLRGALAAGRHSVVVGAEYENSRVTRALRSGGAGFVNRFATNSFRIDAESTKGTFHNLVPTAYIQDSWRATDLLTVNAGVRWSTQILTAASGGTAQRLPDEWQPRVGFSWQLGRPGSQRIFGSYGRFYQQEPLNLSTLYYVDYYFTQTYYSADPRQPGVTPDSAFDYSSYESDYARSIDGVSAERFDEITLGYERFLGAATKLMVRGVRRDLGTTFQQGIDLANSPFFFLGTPGRGDLAFLPPARREYTALELGVDGAWRGLQYRASYVLSRTWGNYTGLYGSDLYFGNPGVDYGLTMPHQALNSTGTLPNDRTHVVKLVTTLRVARALVAGAFFTWQSGTPLNDFGAGPFGAFFPAFLAPRGSVGRTPTLFDLNLRLAYDARWAGGAATRFVFDLLHVGNPQTSVRVDQQHYLALDAQGNQTSANPDYLRPIAFQPPMTARLGVEVGF